MTEIESEPLVSIIIPTYERREYLRGAIQTALGQKYKNMEIIVVDDGSLDPYASQIVSEFPESVTCIRHDENQGLSAARNTGIEQSSGEFIAFLDDDDRWHRNKITRQIEAITQNDGFGLATCLVAAISPDHEVIHCETSAPSGNCTYDLLIGNIIGTPSRVLVRREAINDVGVFDESLPTKQDWDFYIRLCQKWDVIAVEDHLCFRTVHQSMSSEAESSERDNLQILEKHEMRMREHNAWEEAKAEVAGRVGRAYLKQGEHKTARQYLRKSFTSSPTVRRGFMTLLSFTTPEFVQILTRITRKVRMTRNTTMKSKPSLEQVPGLK
jgi:glycosyltransferase involved in cell wall biosynthesis